MNIHHNINESDQKNACPYCGRCALVHKWESNFHNNSHYKEQHCECGRKLSIKVDFYGSGHDSWADGLDRKVVEADSQSQKK